MRKDVKMKKKFFMLTIMLVMFLFTGTVYAEEDDRVCKPTQLSELRSLAANVKVTYVPVEVVEDLGVPDPEEDATKISRKYLYIKIYNLDEKLKIDVKNSGRGLTDTIDITLSKRNADPEGVITLKQAAITETVMYDFEIYSDHYGCTSTLRAFRLTLPKFNYYSQLDICQDIPEYYLCQQYTTYTVNGATFYDKVDEYKAKLLTQKEEDEKNKEEEIDNTTFVSKAMTTVSKNKYIIVGIVVAVGVVITVVILKRKKSVL